jgi:hypothetical protein
MSLESKSEQFNKEKFRGEFEKALSKYISVADFLSNPYLNLNGVDEERVFSLNKVKDFESVKEKEMEHIVDLSIDALKLSKDKQEILDAIFRTFYNKNIELGTPYEDHEFTSIHARLEFAERLILELLK